MFLGEVILSLFGDKADLSLGILHRNAPGSSFSFVRPVLLRLVVVPVHLEDALHLLPAFSVLGREVGFVGAVRLGLRTNPGLSADVVPTRLKSCLTLQRL